MADAVARTQAALDAAAARLGRPVGLDELEGTGPEGRPILPDGLPDNPLVEGTAGVAEWCDGDETRGPRLDWRYCPRTGRFRAGAAATSPRRP